MYRAVNLKVREKCASQDEHLLNIVINSQDGAIETTGGTHRHEIKWSEQVLEGTQQENCVRGLMQASPDHGRAWLSLLSLAVLFLHVCLFCCAATDSESKQ